MFKNKHVVVAMLVAPVLAIMAWFAIDHFVAEKPHAAQPGESYGLLARSNCRYDSGQCDLVNGDFELVLRATHSNTNEVTLELVSKHALQWATIGLAGAPPAAMSASDSVATHWVGSIARPAGEDDLIRIAVVARGTTYYAEIPVVFMQLES